MGCRACLGSNQWKENVTWWSQIVLHAAQRPSREMLTDSSYASSGEAGLVELLSQFEFVHILVVV